MPRQKKITKLLGIGLGCLFLLGCAKESFLLTEEGETTAVFSEAEVLDKDNVDFLDEESQNQESNGSKEVLIEQESENIELISPKREIAVHVCGAVKNPGVYYLEEDKRVCDAIQAASGFLTEADENYLNQALFLQDGMKIYIPTKEETKDLEKEAWGMEASGMKNGETEDFSHGVESGIQKADEEHKKIDLNTADAALLCTLPGIGESRAKSIIAYREKNGPFEKIEDVMKISGIKEAAFEKIKDLITVLK